MIENQVLKVTPLWKSFISFFFPIFLTVGLCSMQFQAANRKKLGMVKSYEVTLCKTAINIFQSSHFIPKYSKILRKHFMVARPKQSPNQPPRELGIHVRIVAMCIICTKTLIMDLVFPKQKMEKFQLRRCLNRPVPTRPIQWPT